MQPVVADWGLELRRGWELFPTEVDGAGALADVRLEGTDGVLVEFPGGWLSRFEAPLAAVERAGTAIEAAGLVPVLAHPERCPAACASPADLAAWARRGWLLCLNAGSLLGDHGRTAQRTAWRLLDDGVAALAASDGHRLSRPPTLDRAHAAVVARHGARRARDLFAGAALVGASRS